MDARTLINLKDYPIDRDGPERDALITSIQRQLDDDGCAVLKGFLTPLAIEMMTAEAEGVAHHAHRSFNRTNAYFTKDDPSLPEDDPRRRFFDRSNSFIPADHFEKSGALRTVHDFPAFDPFIQTCLQQESFYRYADPLADVIINAADEGEGFPWHFDTNNFTITLAIQMADEGGLFEYAPNIRQAISDSATSGDNRGENFDDVRDILDGCSDQIRTLKLEPGDLQLFKGRYSLHRVAPLKGQTPRYVAIFSYVETPDMVGSPERTKQLYGRVLPIHLERAGLRGDRYLD